MAEISKSGTPSLASVGVDPGHGKLSTLLTGEAIAAGDACYVKSDGLIYRSTGAGLAAPAAPALTTATSGGTVLAGEYTAVITYVNPAGETVASQSSDIVTSGSTSTITVVSPAASGTATAYKVYMSPANGGPLALQNGAGTALATNLTLTAPPATGTATPPTSNSTVSAAASKVRGFAPTKANSGESLTLLYHVIFNYGAALTPGADYYLSGTVAGGLADAQSIGGSLPVAFAVDATRIYVKQSSY